MVDSPWVFWARKNDNVNGKITHARVAMGGVGTKPWRSFEAEEALKNAAESFLRSVIFRH